MFFSLQLPCHCLPGFFEFYSMYEWETHSKELRRFLKLFLCVVLSPLVLCLANFSYSGIRPGSGWDYLLWTMVLKGPLGRKPRWFYILPCFLSLMDQKNNCFTHFVQFSSCFWWEVKSGTSFSIIAGSRNSQRPYLKSWYPAISWTNTTLHYQKAQNITNEMKPILRYITVKLQKNKTF